MLLFCIVYFFSGLDENIADIDRVYIVKSRINTVKEPFWISEIPLPANEYAASSNLIESSATVIERHVEVNGNKLRNSLATKNIHPLLLGSPTMQQFFGIKTLKGNLSEALKEQKKIALTVDGANLIFGSTNVIGKEIIIDEFKIHVTALIENPPLHSPFPYIAIAGLDVIPFSNDELVRVKNWQFLNRLYIKIKPQANLDAITHHIQVQVDRNQRLFPRETNLLKKSPIQIGLKSLANNFYDPMIDNKGEVIDRSLVWGVKIVSCLIMFLAITNYVNLTSVKILQRQRELSIRKLLGASTFRIGYQIFLETIGTIIFAVSFAILLVWLVMPICSELVGQPIEQSINAIMILYCYLISLAIAVVICTYPTWFAIKMNLMQALAGRGNFESSLGLWMRRALTVFQFSTAITLTGMLLAVSWQIAYINRFDHGFVGEQLLTLWTAIDPESPSGRDFKRDIEHLPNVVGVAQSNSPIGFGISNNLIIQFRNQPPTNNELAVVDENFFRINGVPIIAGRNFKADEKSFKIDGDRFFPSSTSNLAVIDGHQSNEIVINELAALQLGFPTPEKAINQHVRTTTHEDLVIIGVIPPIIHHNLRTKPLPVIYRFGRPYFFTVKYEGDLQQVSRNIEVIWRKHIPGHAIDLQPAKKLISMNYEYDMVIAKLIAASTVVALSIASFGIFVLAAYNVQRRESEIALRKLHGANRNAIARLIGREFAWIIVVGNAFGLPIAWMAIDKYLSEFIFRAPYIEFSLLIAITIAGSIAVASTLYHLKLAMNLKPADALRTG